MIFMLYGQLICISIMSQIYIDSLAMKYILTISKKMPTFCICMNLAILHQHLDWQILFFVNTFYLSVLVYLSSVPIARMTNDLQRL